MNNKMEGDNKNILVFGNLKGRFFKTLKKLNINIEFFEKEEQLIRYIENNIPEIIIIEEKEEITEILNICKNIKKQENMILQPIIAAGKEVNLKYKKEWLKAGVADYIEEDCEEEELLIRLENQLNKGRISKKILIEVSNQAENSIKQIKEERERTKYYLEASKMAFLIIGRDKNIRYINQEGCNIFEYTLEEIIGKNIVDFISPSKKLNTANIIDGILEEELVGINGIEFEIRNKSGDIKIIESNISLTYVGDNEIDELILSGNDRTAEKILENEREKLLSEMKRKVREIECLYNVAIFSQGGKEIDSSLADIIIKGLKNPELVSVKLIIDNREYVNQKFCESNLSFNRVLKFSGRKVGKIEFYFNSKKIEKSDIAEIEREEHNFLEVLYKMLENIVEGKILEEELINNNIRLKETQEIAKLGTWEYDMEEDRIYWSDETYKIFEITDKENTDLKKYMKKIYPETDKLDNKKAEILKQNKNYENIVVEYEKNNNMTGYAVTNAKAIYKNNKIVKIVGSILDITELKKIQNELEKSKQAAESANIAKTFFIANMSHEIRTPLNAVLGFSQLLMRNNSVDREGKEQIEIILKSGEHLLNIINNILELSKIETGKVNLENEIFDIKEQILDIVNMFVIQAEKKGIKFIYNLKDNNSRLYIGDIKKIKQIFTNLIGNAVKFTEKGKIEIGINTEKISDKKVKIDVFIEDTGIGIPESYIAKAFTRFEQAENNLWKKGGTGLGLAICKDFIDMMGGNISIKSEVDKGSRFEFTIYVEESEREREKSERESSKKVIDRIDKKYLKALIVDDVKENIILLRECLKISGIDVSEAENGKVALEMVRKERYDIIFMDIVMPVMNGIAATTEIRKIDKRVVIAAVTAIAFEEEKKEITQYGIDEFIRKPYREEQIFKILEKRLGVVYNYEEDKTNIADERVEDSEEFKDNIPTDILKSMKNSIINGDMEEIIKTAEEIEQFSKKLSKKIIEFAKEYKFEELNTMFGIKI